MLSMASTVRRNQFKQGGEGWIQNGGKGEESSRQQSFKCLPFFPLSYFIKHLFIQSDVIHMLEQQQGIIPETRSPPTDFARKKSKLKKCYLKNI